MLSILEKRFHENMHLHPDLKWEDVKNKLKNNKKILEALQFMEDSGGQPDTIGIDEKTGKLIYCDCSIETPASRRSLCYDDEALNKRTKNPPTGSAMAQARKHNIELMDEALYRKLQELGSFDTKTSSWISTPKEIRDLGGALFCEKRYGKVFTFHNSADSYYSVRGYRAYILI